MAAGLEEIRKLGARVRMGTITATSPISVSIGGSSQPIEDVMALGTDLEVDQVVPCLMWGSRVLVLAGGGGGTDAGAIHTDDDARLSSLEITDAAALDLSNSAASIEFGGDVTLSRAAATVLKVTGYLYATGYLSGNSLNALVGHDGTSLSAAIALYDGAAYRYIKAIGSNSLGTGSKFTASGGLDAGSNKVTNVANGTTSSDAVNKGQLDLKQDASTAATDAELSAHEADTTNVHGITNTANLVTGPASATNDNLAGFNGTTGKVIEDSGAKAANVPSDDQKAALAGTDGTPSSINKYVTDSDPRLNATQLTLPQAILTLDPELYWDLGANGATDQSGHGRNGTAAGGVTLGGAGSLTSDGGASTNFDGTDDRVTSSYSPFAAGSVITVVAWVNRDASATADTIFGGDGASNGPSVKFESGGGRIELASRDTVGWTSDAPWAASGQTMMVAAVLRTTGGSFLPSIFVNGTVGQIGLAGGSLLDYSSPGNFEVGAREGSTDPFYGRIAHVAVFSHELSVETIAWLYRIGSGHAKDWGLVASLPSGASIGDTCFYEADATNGVLWNLVHDGQGSYPWKVIGGRPLFSEVGYGSAQSTSSTSYTTLSTAHSLSVPLAGDYDVEWGAEMSNNTAGDGAAMAIKIGSATTSDNDRIGHFSSSALFLGNPSRTRRLTGLSASTVISTNYRALSGGTASFLNRRLSLMPVRVG